MIIALGSDHAGYELKEAIKDKLKMEGYQTLDLGTHSKSSVDYPVYGHAVGHAVADGVADKGIAICGSGIGISIACNKVQGIRCALCTSTEMAKLSRRHNDSNVLALGARIINNELAFDIVDTWMATEFEGGRHQRRVDIIEE